MGVRQGRAADLDAVLALISQGGEPIPNKPGHDAFRRLTTEDREGFVLVYEKDGAVAGVCTVSLAQAIRSSGPYAIIQEMYVVPELRRQGIGAELVEEAISQTRLLGCSMVELGTPLNGHRQERFYERLGFQIVGSRLRKRL